MLKIIIELHPFGDSTRKKEIASMELWNDASGTRDQGNYAAVAVTQPSPWNPHVEERRGLVVGHSRDAPIWDLVKKMLHAMQYNHEDA